MTTILVAFQTTTTPDGQRNWKALDFNFEYQSGEKDFEKFVRLLKKAASYHIGKLKLSFEGLKALHADMTGFSKPGVVLLTIRISDVIGGPSEKITLSMPSDLISKIDKFVADSPDHQSRSAFLADAALKLILDQSEDFDYKDVKILGPRLTTEF